MSIDRVTHLLEQMHRSEDDAGDPIPAGRHLVTDGATGFTWEDVGSGGNAGGIWHVPPTEALGERTELLADGAWSWFADPRAIFDSGLTLFGWVNTSGDIGITAYDHEAESASSFTLHAALQVDDHDNASVLVRNSDKKILAFYTSHDDTTVRLRISSNPLDISAFAAEVSLDASLGGTDYTYPNTFELLEETNDPIYLWYRDIPSGTQYNLAYSKSTDGGATWAAQTTVAGGTRSYWKIAQNGQDRFDFAFTDAHPNFSDPSIFHFYYQGGAYYQSDGTAMGAPPFTTADMTLVYDGTGSNAPAWIHDIAIDPVSGQPIVAFATFVSSSDHRYRYGRWNGTEWRTVEVCEAGDNIYGTGDEPHYSAGVNLDHEAPGIVYAAREVSGQFEMWRYVTRDGGQTFSGEALTESSTDKNIRPVGVRGSGPLRVLWLFGDYTTYTNYDLAVVGAFLETGGSLDWAEVGDIEDVGTTASAGVLDEVPRGDHVHALTGAVLESLGVRGELLISDTPSTPLVFADILQNDTEDALLYADLGA